MKDNGKLRERIRRADKEISKLEEEIKRVEDSIAEYEDRRKYYFLQVHRFEGKGNNTQLEVKK